MTRRVLGKGLQELGLAELLSNPAHSQSQSELRKIAVNLIKPGRFQPRRKFDPQSLQELAISIKAQGVIQPIVVRSINNIYEIIAGERRWRAAVQAGLQEIPALVKSIPDKAVLAVSLIENIQREDLNAIEEALALKKLITDFKMTHQQIADAIGSSRSKVTNMLRLLALSHEAGVLLQQGKIEMGHARALLTLDAKLQVKIAHDIIKQGLSVRQTERLVHNLHNPAAPRASAPFDITQFENKFSTCFGMPAKIRHHKKGSGRLILQYKNLQELNGILQKLEGE